MPNELLFSRLGAQTWTALISGGRPVELHVASPTCPDPVERIVRGRVCGLRPEIQAAFVEIGLARPAFIRAVDLPDEPGAVPAPPIQDRLKVGRDLIVQVVRGPVGDKGARVTCRVGLPGAHLVCRPFDRELKVARRIGDPGQRRRLLDVLKRCPGDSGWVARTRASAAEETEILADAARLLARWRRVEHLAATSPAPVPLESEPDLPGRLLRDLPRESLDRIVVDTPEDRERVAGELARIDPSRVARIELHSGPSPLVEIHGLLAEAARSLNPRVPLACGGYLVVEPTEALLAVDVNTGSFAGPPEPGETALETNLEAVTELARQLRLRDLGGTIVVDLIEMTSERDRLRVREALDQALRNDRARTRIVGWSDHRLLHLTRRRVRPGLSALLARPCAECAGRGALKSALLVAAEALAEMRRLAADDRAGAVRVEAHPEVARELHAALAPRPFPFTVSVVEVPRLSTQTFELHRH